MPLERFIGNIAVTDDYFFGFRITISVYIPKFLEAICHRCFSKMENSGIAFSRNTNQLLIPQ